MQTPLGIELCKPYNNESLREIMEWATKSATLLSDAAAQIADKRNPERRALLNDRNRFRTLAGELSIIIRTNQLSLVSELASQPDD